MNISLPDGADCSSDMHVSPASSCRGLLNTFRIQENKRRDAIAHTTRHHGGF